METITVFDENLSPTEMRAEEIEMALRAGCRISDGSWPPLPLVWTTARYVALGELEGVEGLAAHLYARTWRFLYRDRGPLGRIVTLDVLAQCIEV